MGGTVLANSQASPTIPSRSQILQAVNASIYVHPSNPVCNTLRKCIKIMNIPCTHMTRGYSVLWPCAKMEHRASLDLPTRPYKLTCPLCSLLPPLLPPLQDLCRLPLLPQVWLLLVGIFISRQAQCFRIWVLFCLCCQTHLGSGFAGQTRSVDRTLGLSS